MTTVTRSGQNSHVGRETRQVTKLFKNIQVKIAYPTNSSLEKLVHNNVTGKTDKYEKSGVYQLSCHTCRKKYMCQTSRPLHIKFREHYNDYKYAYKKSKFAQHAFGPMYDVMDIAHFARKGKMLDTLEKFYIYEVTKSGNQINDKLTVQYNPIFETVVQHLHRRHHQQTQ
jgi:hypothetical protein